MKLEELDHSFDRLGDYLDRRADVYASQRTASSAARPRWPLMLGAAAAALVLVGVGVIVTGRRVPQPLLAPVATSTSIPVEQVTVFAPGRDGDVTLVDARPANEADAGTPIGTVIGPSGYRYLVQFDGRRSGAPEATQITVGTRAVGVTNVAGIDFYDFRQGCGSIGISTTATRESAEIRTMIAAMSGDGLRARLELPSGWTSLGWGYRQRDFQITYTATVDGQPIELKLTQTASLPLGPTAYVGDRVRSVRVGSAAGWFAEGDHPSLAWEQDGHSLVLLASSPSATVTAEQLTKLAQALEPMPWLTLLQRAPRAPLSSGEYRPDGSVPAGCEGDRQMTITVRT